MPYFTDRRSSSHGFIPILGLVVVAFLTISLVVVSQVTNNPNFHFDPRSLANFEPGDGGGGPPPPPEETPAPQETPPSTDRCGDVCASVECGSYSGCSCGGCNGGEICDNNQCVSPGGGGACKVCINEGRCGSSGASNCDSSKNECNANSDCVEATNPPTPEPTLPPNPCEGLCTEVACGSYSGCNCGGCVYGKICSGNSCVNDPNVTQPCRICSGSSCINSGVQGCNPTANECRNSDECHPSATPTPPPPGATPRPPNCGFADYSSCYSTGCQNCSYCGDGSWECASQNPTTTPQATSTPGSYATPYPNSTSTPLPGSTPTPPGATPTPLAVGYCGDGNCGVNESCGNCPGDCGTCYSTPIPTNNPTTNYQPTPTPDIVNTNFYGNQTTSQYSPTLSYSYNSSLYTSPSLTNSIQYAKTVSYDPLYPYDNTCQNGDPECLALQEQGKIVIPLMMGGTLASAAAPLLPAIGEAGLYAYSYAQATLTSLPAAAQTTLLVGGSALEVGTTALGAFECSQGNQDACMGGLVGGQMYLEQQLISGASSLSRNISNFDVLDQTTMTSGTTFAEDALRLKGGGTYFAGTSNQRLIINPNNDPGLNSFIQDVNQYVSQNRTSNAVSRVDLVTDFVHGSIQHPGNPDLPANEAARLANMRGDIYGQGTKSDIPILGDLPIIGDILKQRNTAKLGSFYDCGAGVCREQAALVHTGLAEVGKESYMVTGTVDVNSGRTAKHAWVEFVDSRTGQIMVADATGNFVAPASQVYNKDYGGVTNVQRFQFVFPTR